MSGVPVHGFFGNDRHNSRCQCEYARYSQLVIIASCDLLDSGKADAKTGDQKDGAEYKRSDTFHTFVSVRMRCIGFFGRETCAKPGNKSGEDIGHGMDRIRYHRSGMAGDAGKKLEGSQQDVAEDACYGNVVDDFVVVCHKITSVSVCGRISLSYGTSSGDAFQG